MTTSNPTADTGDRIAEIVDDLVDAGFVRVVPPEEVAANAAAVERVRSAVAKVSQGAITFTDLLKLVAPPPPPVVPPATAPMPPVITDAQRQALDRLLEVFGVVVPTERRVLAVPEIASLTEERLTLDEIEALAKARKEAIRTIIFNHFDAQVDAEATAARARGEEYELPPRDDRGHYVRVGRAVAPGEPKAFTRETRAGTVNLDPEMLRLLADDPLMHAALLEQGIDFTHDDYLAMTRPVRVLDEAKVMIALRTRPDLIHAIKAATTAGPKTAAMWMRKA